MAHTLWQTIENDAHAHFPDKPTLKVLTAWLFERILQKPSAIASPNIHIDGLLNLILVDWEFWISLVKN